MRNKIASDIFDFRRAKQWAKCHLFTKIEHRLHQSPVLSTEKHKNYLLVTVACVFDALWKILRELRGDGNTLKMESKLAR